MDNNNFSLIFGQQPASYVERYNTAKKIYDDFMLDYPLSKFYIISGVQGSGKTVLLTRISRMIKENKDWIVIDLNPNRELLSQLAAGIYENSKVKHLFLSTSFSISFKGFGFGIEGKEPVSNIKTVVEKMLNVIKKSNKKVLMTIDEVSNNNYMRAFAHDFQSLLREEYPVYILMTGLYENVSSLQNSKNLTFLYRAPKIDLEPLNIRLIEEEYKKVFKNSDDEIIAKLAILTNGYAFAYQVIGMLYAKYNNVDLIYDELDAYLSLYSYSKIWEELPLKEKKFLYCFKKQEMTTKEVLQESGLNQKEYSVYRDRLIKRGLLSSKKYGLILLVLPRFLEFIQKQSNGFDS